MRKLLTLVVFSMLAFIVACSSVEADYISVSDSRVDVLIGESKTVTAEVRPEDADQTVTWEVANDEVATVEDGVITGVEAGATTVTVRSGSAFALIDVRVSTPPTDDDDDDDEEETFTYSNGRYRGIYSDRGEMQISIQFDLTDDVITSVSYRWLYHSGVDYRQLDDTDLLYQVKLQHDQIAEYLVGKDITEIEMLHTPGEIADDTDAFTGATLRGNKIYSAMKDALNRGAYSPADKDNYTVELGDLADGRYRGIYGDRNEQQVSLQFTLTDNVISSVSFRWLAYGGTDYRQLGEDDALYAVKLQHDQIASYLEGKDITAIFELHQTENFVDDVDTFTGATVRGNKVYSAFRDALNRGLYTPADASTYAPDLGDFEDGRYRGIYEDRGYQQVSIQFTLTDNTISNMSYRWLFHSDTDYRTLDDEALLYAVKLQHDQIASYFEGKDIQTIFELHTPGDFVDDVDAFTGATLRGNKIFSAIIDALNRGLYTPAS